MSTSKDFKILEIPVDGVNSYIPPIVVNEADNNGRHLKFTPTYEGQPVTGITSARMYYDPRPRDASSIGDYVDGTKDGDGWVFVLPPNTFTANVQGIASVSFTDEDGETYTRSIPIDVEPGGTKIDSQGTRIDRLIATLEQMVNDFTMTADAETGPAGSQASVNVTRLSNGSYKLDFTIPTGERGPKGDPGDLTTVAHDDTLTGDGTSGNPISVSKGTLITPRTSIYEASLDLNDVRNVGVYDLRLQQGSSNTPIPVTEMLTGAMLVLPGGYEESVIQILFERTANGGGISIYARGYASFTQKWTSWAAFAVQDTAHALASNMTALENLEVRVQALEAKLENK